MGLSFGWIVLVNGYGSTNQPDVCNSVPSVWFFVHENVIKDSGLISTRAGGSNPMFSHLELKGVLTPLSVRIGGAIVSAIKTTADP